MAEGSYEMTGFGRPDNIAGVRETSFIDPAEAPLVMSPSYQRIEGRLKEKIQSSTGVASPSRRDAGFTIRPNDGKNKSLYFINFITK